jgi:hypothetical protein
MDQDIDAAFFVSRAAGQRKHVDENSRICSAETPSRHQITSLRIFLFPQEDYQILSPS